LDALKRKGFIECDAGRARFLRVISPLRKLPRRIMDIPLFVTFPRGFAQNNEQEAEGCVSLDVASIGF
jgi:hypothetical protein